MQKMTADNLILQYLSKKSMYKYNKWHKYLIIWHAGTHNVCYTYSNLKERQKSFKEKEGERLMDKSKIKKMWIADQGDGTYTNPILYTDYSDPDAIRVGEDYFMIASSFCNSPAVPLWRPNFQPL